MGADGKVYKVMDGETGLYATSGFKDWNAVGKAWSTAGAAKNAIAMAIQGPFPFSDRKRDEIPASWWVVELEIKTTKMTPAIEFFVPVSKR